MILDANYSCERLRAAAATLNELRRIVRKRIVVLIEATPPAVRKARSCPAVLPAGAPNPASADVFRGLELLCCVFLWGVQPGEEEALGEQSAACQSLEGDRRQERERLLTWVDNDRTKGSGFKLKERTRLGEQHVPNSCKRNSRMECVLQCGETVSC